MFSCASAGLSSIRYAGIREASPANATTVSAQLSCRVVERLWRRYSGPVGASWSSTQGHHTVQRWSSPAGCLPGCMSRFVQLTVAEEDEHAGLLSCGSCTPRPRRWHRHRTLVAGPALCLLVCMVFNGPSAQKGY
jgi:hypothetical protein